MSTSKLTFRVLSKELFMDVAKRPATRKAHNAYGRMSYRRNHHGGVASSIPEPELSQSFYEIRVVKISVSPLVVTVTILNGSIPTSHVRYERLFHLSLNTHLIFDAMKYSKAGSKKA